jgi:hypothetical protein
VIAEVRSASEQGRVQCRLRREHWTPDNILKTCAAAQKQVGASLFNSMVGLFEKLAICRIWSKILESYLHTKHFFLIDAEGASVAEGKKKASLLPYHFWVSVGRPSPLDRALAQRIRVIGGCVIWVRWAPHRYLGGYVGPGLSLWSFRLLF